MNDPTLICCGCYRSLGTVISFPHWVHSLKWFASHVKVQQRAVNSTVFQCMDVLGINCIIMPYKSSSFAHRVHVAMCKVQHTKLIQIPRIYI